MLAPWAFLRVNYHSSTRTDAFCKYFQSALNKWKINFNCFASCKSNFFLYKIIYIYIYIHIYNLFPKLVHFTILRNISVKLKSVSNFVVVFSKKKLEVSLVSCNLTQFAVYMLSKKACSTSSLSNVLHCRVLSSTS